MEKEFSFMKKSPSDLAKEANEALKNHNNDKELTLEEETEEDAEYGYFQED